jgi:hypothetical protein
MRLSIIFNLRADAGWVDLVRTQATDAGRSNAGRYIRDLVWLLSSEPEFKAVVIRKLQGVRYGQP